MSIRSGPPRRSSDKRAFGVSFCTSTVAPAPALELCPKFEYAELTAPGSLPGSRTDTLLPPVARITTFAVLGAWSVRPRVCHYLLDLFG